MKLRTLIGKPLVWILAGAAVVVTAGWGISAGWQHMADRPCTEINLQGVRYVDRAALEAMILDTMDADIVADRLRRHPWVRASSAFCYPNGILHVWIEERVPRGLLLSQGQPAYYVDRFGFMMPMDTVMAFDVPLIHNAPVSYRPLEPAEHQGLRTLVAMLPSLDATTDSLISEFIFSNDELDVITRPISAGTATRVMLGKEQWEARLKRLDAFWRQQAAQVPDRNYETIDLRFNGQIITVESTI